MSNSTQNDHETHTACIDRIMKEGADAACCYCSPHKGCTLYVKPSTQNDWEKRFLKEFVNTHNQTWRPLRGLWVEDVLDFIRKELADARKEVIQRVVSVLPLGDDPRYRELKDVLATLREEEVATAYKNPTISTEIG